MATTTNGKKEISFYTKTGTGEPILLIHDTDSGASGEEWAKVAKKACKEQYRIHY